MGRDVSRVARPRRIDHPAVIETYGCGTTTQHLPCVLLAWCASDASRALALGDVGDDGRMRARVLRDWPSRERLRLCLEVADALDHLHSGAALPRCAVLHRDIKPDNVGITDTRRVKLVDFGLAVALDLDDDDKRDEAGGALREAYDLTGETGSRRYMAPEVALGRPYGTGVDVFSWAVVAVEILALRGKPFAGLGLEAHARRVVKGGERPSIPSRWHPRLAALFPEAWAGDPKRRCDAARAKATLAAVLASADDGGDPLASGASCACLVS